VDLENLIFFEYIMNLEDSNQKKVTRLIEARRKIDAPGLLLAQREGRLLEYLHDDLKTAGIDPKTVKLPANAPSQSANSSSEVTNRNRGRRPRQTEGSSGDLFEQVSQTVDDAFEQLFKSNLSSGIEESFYDQMSNTESFRKIDGHLRSIKVACVFATPVLLLISLGNFARASPVRGAFYGILAADSIRVAFNCYTKNYLYKALKTFGGDGDAKKIGGTLLQWASNTLGLSKGDDQLSRFQKGILWEVVFDESVFYRAYLMVGLSFRFTPFPQRRGSTPVLVILDRALLSCVVCRLKVSCERTD
jgi:hypothetical protein